MKKLIIFLYLIFLLTGCNQRKSHFDDIEFDYAKNNNELKCIKQEKDTHYRIWTFQNPNTNEIVRQTLTIDKAIEYYDLDDERADSNAYAWLCGDYDLKKFDNCEIERYMAGIKKSSARVKVKYTYKLLEPSEDDIYLLEDIKTQLEKDGYKCELNSK